MRRPLVVANWKMNTTLSDATVLATQIKNSVDDYEAEVVLCPPFTWLVPLHEILEKSPDNIKLGAQNMHFADAGPLTGEISPVMLKDLVRYVILGHSERRLQFGETDELVNDKIHSALGHNLRPIVCVGELKKKEDVTRGRPSSYSLRTDAAFQLEKAIEGIGRDEIRHLVVTYEPVWAISKGTTETRHAATGAYANNTIIKLREILAKKYGQEVASEIRFLYGGSVDENNIKEFLLQPEIDGVLVGGASLKAKEFIEMVKYASGRD